MRGRQEALMQRYQAWRRADTQVLRGDEGERQAEQGVRTVRYFSFTLETLIPRVPALLSSNGRSLEIKYRPTCSVPRYVRIAAQLRISRCCAIERARFCGSHSMCQLQTEPVASSFSFSTIEKLIIAQTACPTIQKALSMKTARDG